MLSRSKIEEVSQNSFVFKLADRHRERETKRERQKERDKKREREIWIDREIDR